MQPLLVQHGFSKVISNGVARKFLFGDSRRVGSAGALVGGLKRGSPRRWSQKPHHIHIVIVSGKITGNNKTFQHKMKSVINLNIS